MTTATAKFDLSLSLGEQRGADGAPAGIHGVLEYATDLFDRTSIEALVGRLVRLLEAAVADADRPIGSLDILSPDERRTILHGWNDTARAIPAATLPELFAAQVANTPDAVAVVFEDERLSYGELDARATSWRISCAHSGVGPEVLVGLCLERSLEMVVALLAVLKAGGAYVPLDPDYPAERLRLHAGRCEARGAAHASALLATTLPLPAGAATHRCSTRPTRAAEPDTAPSAPLEPRAPGLHDLHLGLHRQPEGRRHHASWSAQPIGSDAERLRGSTSR